MVSIIFIFLMGIVIRAPSFPKFPVDFVPTYKTTIEHLFDFYQKSKRLLVITGAGISTDSGIPDYRSPGRPPSNPILYHNFISSLDVRKRYWGRGLIGYTRFSSTKPNQGHQFVALMEKIGKTSGIITQNVDGYHQEAGAERVLELHGNLHVVHCMDCDSRYPRSEFQEKMMHENNEFFQQYSRNLLAMKADGDVELSDYDFGSFILPRCLRCDSIHVQPDIVFMGGHIRPEIRDRATRWTKEADAVLVIGSTLTVYSAYRLIRLAKELGYPVAVINQGETRADPFIDIKIEKPITATLQSLAKCCERK